MSVCSKTDATGALFRERKSVYIHSLLLPSFRFFFFASCGMLVSRFLFGWHSSCLHGTDTLTAEWCLPGLKETVDDDYDATDM